MNKKSKEIIGLPVIGITDGVQIGVIGGLLVNPQNKTLEMLLLEGEKDSNPKGIAFLSAEGIGEYAVTVENDKVFINLQDVGLLKDLLEKDIAVIGTKVITKKGRYLGDVTEYAVDTEKGTLVEFYYQSEGGVEKTVGVQSVITIGKEVLVVQDIDDSLQESSSEKKRLEAEQIGFRDEMGYSGEDQPGKQSKVISEGAEPARGEVYISSDEQRMVEDVFRHGKDTVVKGTDGQDTSSIFLQHQRRYLVGKKLLKDIRADNGEIIARENEVVTEELYQQISEMGAQKLIELTVSLKD
ncbi:MAG TPA: hypothetical protein GX004_04380 [Firmicutes bacterium]|nr:hypothetical protein [Bacillota bacterium]